MTPEEMDNIIEEEYRYGNELLEIGFLTEGSVNEEYFEYAVRKLGYEIYCEDHVGGMPCLDYIFALIPRNKIETLKDMTGHYYDIWF